MKALQTKCELDRRSFDKVRFITFHQEYTTRMVENKLTVNP